MELRAQDKSLVTRRQFALPEAHCVSLPQETGLLRSLALPRKDESRARSEPEVLRLLIATGTGMSVEEIATVAGAPSQRRIARAKRSPC